VRPDELTLLVFLLAAGQQGGPPPDIMGTWQSSRTLTLQEIQKREHPTDAQRALLATPGAVGRLRLTFAPGECRVEHPKMDASYPCHVTRSGADGFVVEHLDPERHRPVKRRFRLEAGRLHTRIEPLGIDEVFVRVRAPSDRSRVADQGAEHH
jgi:hypothetical protein